MLVLQLYPIRKKRGIRYREGKIFFLPLAVSPRQLHQHIKLAQRNYFFQFYHTKIRNQLIKIGFEFTFDVLVELQKKLLS
jgi:hypothetical protein